MAFTGTVNGTPVVFNNVLVSIDGTTEIGVNGYITDLSWSTGTQVEHVQTLNPSAQPIQVNAINSSPTFSLNFAPMGEQAFYSILGDRWSKFTMLLTYYVTGDLSGATQTVLLQNCQQDVQTGSSGAQRPANFGSISFKCTYCGFI